MSSIYHSHAPCGHLDRSVDRKANFGKAYKHWFLTLDQQPAFLECSRLILKEHKTDEIELADASRSKPIAKFLA